MQAETTPVQTSGCHAGGAEVNRMTSKVSSNSKTLHSTRPWLSAYLHGAPAMCGLSPRRESLLSSSISAFMSSCCGEERQIINTYVCGVLGRGGSCEEKLCRIKSKRGSRTDRAGRKVFRVSLFCFPGPPAQWLLSLKPVPKAAPTEGETFGSPAGPPEQKQKQKQRQVYVWCLSPWILTPRQASRGAMWGAKARAGEVLPEAPP